MRVHPGLGHRHDRLGQVRRHPAARRHARRADEHADPGLHRVVHRRSRGRPGADAPGECRTSYDVVADIAEKFGMREEFTEGRTQEEWIKYLYEQGAEKDGDMPTWEEIQSRALQARADRLHRPGGLPQRSDRPTRWPRRPARSRSTPSAGRDGRTCDLAEGERHQPHPRVRAGLPGLRHTSPRNSRCTAAASTTRAAPTRRSASSRSSKRGRRQQVWINPATRRSAASRTAIAAP